MPQARQLRLLLWKDYLTRKRKLITLAGILWATAVMVSIYIVRANVDNVTYSTCQFPARALPSAGMLPFLQSFICSVNNECEGLDKFDEIPTYENSKLTQLQKQFSPLLYNETVLDVAATVPDALKLLSKLADIVDEPTFIDISKNGLRVRDLFTNPSRVKRYLSTRLKLSSDVIDSVMAAELSFQGMFKGGANRCNLDSISETIIMDNIEHTRALVGIVCALSDKDVQTVIMDLMMEVDFKKFITMIGNMFTKLTGDDRITALGDTVTAVLRMTRLQNFLPKELVEILIRGEDDFSYFDLDLVHTFVDLFKPTFGNTEGFASIKELADTLITGLRYLNKIVPKTTNTVDIQENIDGGLKVVDKLSNNALQVIQETDSIDIFSILAQVTKFVHRWLPNSAKHNMLLYSTLLTKLIEGANTVIHINMNIEQRAYNVSLRHAEGIKVLLGLPSNIIGKGFDGLADAERTQVMTAKISTPGQMFCDLYRLQTFFRISKEDATSLKTQLCTDVWKNLVADLLRTFGVYDVKDNINAMASLLIQETLGKDTSSQLYSIEHEFQVLKNFTQGLTKITKQNQPEIDWTRLFNVSDDSEFMKTVRKKAHLGKQMLIIAHGALAKEVVNQNSILSYKIAPGLIDTTTLVTALNNQLDSTSKELVGRVREKYPWILETIVRTALNEDKTHKSLSTHSEVIMCNGLDNVLNYLELPQNVDQEDLVHTLCDISRAIENGLKKDSFFGKALKDIQSGKRHGSGVKWTTLINGLKDLYVKLERDYPYLFEYNTYGLNEEKKIKMDELVEVAKKLWFGGQSIGKGVHLGFNFGFRLLDLIDRDIFNITNASWQQMKYSLFALSGPFTVANDFIHTVAAIYRDKSFTSNLPPATVNALKRIVPNIPQLIVDGADIIVNDNTELEPIIAVLNAEPPWPCASTSLSALLPLSPGSEEAVQALETILCMDMDFSEEWRVYLENNNVTLFDLKKWNTTTYPPHVYLKFSSSLDGLIEDVNIIQNVLEDFKKESGSEPGTWSFAWNHVVDVLKRDDRDVLFIKLLSKVDTALSSINTTSTPITSLHMLWGEYLSCYSGQIQDNCRTLGRETWKRSLQFIAVIFRDVAADWMVYFTESNEPQANALQLLGFTRNTPLFEMFEKLPDLMGVLMHSYFDYGFMSQIRRASLSQFWDCEAVLASMVPPPGSVIDVTALKRIQPYACVSFLYWFGLPRGENKFVDVVAKPNYYFYTFPAQNLTSSYEEAYTIITNFSNFMFEIANKNQTLLTEDDIKMNTIQYKLEKLVDSIINYKLNESDPSYKRFYEVNKKYFASSIYLTRVVSIINKLATAIDEQIIDNIEIVDEDKKKKVGAELAILKKTFKRRPSDIIAVHFDVLTDVIWRNDDNYTLIDAIESTCNDMKNNDTSKVILVENNRVKNQICAKTYQQIYKGVENDFVDDYLDARNSLMNLVQILQSGDNSNVTDIFEFLKQRNQLITSLQRSIKHSYDLGLPIYLQYLQSNLRHYDVIASFLSGGDWWGELRRVYDGARGKKFFDSVENSFEIVGDVLSGFDRIHLVRLLREINLNDSDAFCSPNIVLSDFIPDSTGAFSELKTGMCAEEKTELFRELPPLLFASQGYDSALVLNKTINYTKLNLDLTNTESNLDLINQGLQSPQRPPWVTEDKLTEFRQVAVNVLSKESLTRMVFGVFSNVVDGGTLFLNNSQCTVCSQLTSWLKQLNLQVFKKQEYDNLLCRMHEMSLEEVHHTLQNDFHWDMAIQELIQPRNYTKYELNKSMNDFLELVKLHLLEDMMSDSAKLSDCLIRNVTKNEFGNVTLVISILSHTSRLFRAQTPHFHEVDGVKSLTHFKRLEKQVAPNLDVTVALKKYLNGMEKELEKIGEIGKEILSADVNLRLLPTLQTQEFWRFTFVSRILYHIERLLNHAARILGTFSHVDVQGVVEGKLAALVDFLVQVLTDEVADDIVYSLQGLILELQPLLHNTTLQHDLEALSTGLTVVGQFKKYLLKEVDLRLEVSKLISHSERVEYELGNLGINNTNFWSIAAPRVQAGFIDLKPILTQKPNNHLSSYVCQIDTMSKVIIPANLDVVTNEDVFAAIVEQFCGMPDTVVKQAVGVLMSNVNYTTIIGKVTDTLLPLLYSAANLTQSEGAVVLNKYPQMAALLPVIQNSVGDLGETIAKEPLIQSFKGAGSVGGLLGSAEFLSNAGKMMCGKPFQTDMNRFYKAIAASKDYSEEPDQAQLDVLPTDFCRDMYKDILNMDGGKIVWSFVKPLIMGKILYTPVNPTVQRIVEKANSSFAHMIKLTSLIHSFSGAFSSLDTMSEHRAGLSALRRIISSPSFSDLKNMLLGDAAVPDVDVDGVFDEFGDLQGIGSLLKRGSDMLRCINLNRFKPVSDEYQLTHEAVKLSRVNEFSAGLVFMNTENKRDFKNVEYKIRMDIENAPTTARLKNYLWIPGPESSFIEHMRYFRGFIQLQDLVDNAIIQLSRSNASRRKREIGMEDKYRVYTQQEPYPCYRKDFFQTSLYESQALMVALFFSLLFTVASTVRFIVADRESGNTMLMSVMGVNLTNHTLSWFITSLVEMTVTVLCMCAVLYFGGILPNTDPTLMFALLMVFGLAVLAFCYMMSKLFKTASLAAVCSAIAYLMTFMPFVLILSLEAVLSYFLKMIVCLSMSTSICYALLNITRSEARGRGSHWGDLWSIEEGDLSIGIGALICLFDGALYVAIGYLLDKYFGPKTMKSSITNCKTSDEKAGVSIVNVTKIYGERSRSEKMALDNVSIELHKGQVTTLLGHNGAGKTTLINILTGSLKPSKGHVIIRSEHDDGTQVGVCPQKDVLFECLTAAEHVALYAQLKSNLPIEMLNEEIEYMLQVLSLGPIAHEPVYRLSGGTRRRVCVALAFVARPKLVSLDEPTAGVDPAARRDIWSMIVKLRQDRTILLTTHHLDEAELLSDQIVIMHKGQVHTTGSPIDIKRSLGNGYKLSVLYPKPVEPWSETFTIEERTKQLLAIVRNDVKNASLIDVNGLEVLIGLPFFDANGLNNNFLALCTSLEQKERELGYKSYTLDCSSLEQVFFNITQQNETPQNTIEFDPDAPSKSASTSSVRSDNTPLVSAEGPLRGSAWQQFLALLHARYIHYTRNRWLLFLLIVLPMLFVTVAMAFSMIRPPPDNEISLMLTPHLYEGSTDYIVSHPKLYPDSQINPTLAESILEKLKLGKNYRVIRDEDTPICNCTETSQVCESSEINRPEMLDVPDVETLNKWIVASHDQYIEKRYGGFSSAVKNNLTHLVAWYNNKGHHAMPAYLNTLNNAILKATSKDDSANITVYSHPLKISEEQLSKDTVYQHIADAGISGLVLIAYCLVSGGASIYLVSARRSQQKRLQLLCGVSPALYWAAALAADMIVIIINMLITVIVFEAFGFPVFVSRSNLPAICLLILLYGFACGSFVHVAEKLFSDASLANMILFCGNAFVGLAGITLLLILDIISDSDATDNARWTLHKILLLCPQFVLGDGMLEIAKNTVQAQVLIRFGMDTYRDPLTTDLIMYHYIALVLVGTALLLLNLAMEYDYFEWLMIR
ncbi:hypothetical protein O0L34_g10339 [Tuta absoluta]|nr:hypothetical protein O0L34_g10339 [Tuta absoluta]